MCLSGWPRTRDPPTSVSFSKSYHHVPPQPATHYLILYNFCQNKCHVPRGKSVFMEFISFLFKKIYLITLKYPHIYTHVFWSYFPTVSSLQLPLVYPPHYPPSCLAPYFVISNRLSPVSVAHMFMGVRPFTWAWRPPRGHVPQGE